MDTLLEPFSKKIGRGDFAIRYVFTAILVFFITGGVWNSNLSLSEGIILMVAGSYAILLAIQRLNDLGLSRWYILLSIIPIVNLIFGVALLSRKGKMVSVIAQNHEAGAGIKNTPNEIAKLEEKNVFHSSSWVITAINT